MEAVEAAGEGGFTGFTGFWGFLGGFCSRPSPILYLYSVHVIFGKMGGGVLKATFQPSCPQSVTLAIEVASNRELICIFFITSVL